MSPALRRPVARATRIGALLAPAALAVALLAGCAADPASTASPTPSAGSTTTDAATPTPGDGGTTPTATPTASATPTPTPSASTTPKPGGTTVSLSCEQVLSDQQVYDFNPNFGPNPDYSPKAGTAPASAVAMKGVACSWLNQTSKEVLEVSVAKPSDLAGAEKRTAAASTPTTVFGSKPQVSGYFMTTGGAGQAEAFSDGYWVVVRSGSFVEAGDAAKVVDAVLGNLG